MNHLVLLLACILSIEAFVQFNFPSVLNSILKVIKKVIHVIPQDNISDHWKEKVIPAYALKIMKNSLQILLILFLIMSLFLIADFFFDDLLALTLSLIGVTESMVFAFGYAYLRKSLIK
jgi:ABC-type uncharacterized transport system permease subunit